MREGLVDSGRDDGITQIIVGYSTFFFIFCTCFFLSNVFVYFSGSNFVR